MDMLDICIYGVLFSIWMCVKKKIISRDYFDIINFLKFFMDC